jgi:predicted aspartyl protease
LTNLIGGLPLTVSCTLVKNGIGIDLNVLIDTGANGFVFIDLTLTDQLCKGLGL